jgi:hypothetical protein
MTPATTNKDDADDVHKRMTIKVNKGDTNDRIDDDGDDDDDDAKKHRKEKENNKKT